MSFIALTALAAVLASQAGFEAARAPGDTRPADETRMADEKRVAEARARYDEPLGMMSASLKVASRPPGAKRPTTDEERYFSLAPLDEPQPPPAPKSIEKDVERVLDWRMMVGVHKVLGLVLADAAGAYGAGVTGLAAAQFNLVAHPFNNPKLRNGWDKFESWTSALGPVVLAAGIIFAANGEKDAAYTTGGVAGVSLLLGQLGKRRGASRDAPLQVGAAGKSYTDDAAGILEQLEVSRRAYDDIKIQQALFQDTRKKASQRLEKVKELRDRADALEKEVETLNANRDELIAFVDDVIAAAADTQLMATFVIQYTSSLHARVEQYKTTVKDPPLLQNLSAMDAELAQLRADFQSKLLVPFFEKMPVLVTQLQGWRQHAFEKAAKP